MTRKVMGPFNRVEGDLEITLDVDDGRIAGAYVNSTLYRGFENILLGKNALDALVYVPRICGICSVSQSVAAALALSQALGVTPARNGQLANNLILANESVTDLFTHFYLFFMPDFAREEYCGKSWYPFVQQRFKAQTGDAVRDVLPARADFLHLMGLLAGRWPHTLSVQPGGTTRPVLRHDQARGSMIIASFRRFLENTLIGDSLERFLALESVSALENWRHEQAWQHDDLRTFLHLSDELKLEKLGKANDHYLSYGSYAVDGNRLMPAGIWTPKVGVQGLDISRIREDISHAYMNGEIEQSPDHGSTRPNIDKESAYSWCKAPRLDGEVYECGALARALVSADPLMTEIVTLHGGSVKARLLARIRELCRVVVAMQRWIMEIDTTAPFCNHPDKRAASSERSGVGLVEAARGSLGHWITLDNRDRITGYQIIAPTTWNFSPRDQHNQPGALEQALIGTAVTESNQIPVEVQHIVRSFDPCMVCTVH